MILLLKQQTDIIVGTPIPSNQLFVCDGFNTYSAVALIHLTTVHVVSSWTKLLLNIQSNDASPRCQKQLLSRGQRPAEASCHRIKAAVYFIPSPLLFRMPWKSFSSLLPPMFYGRLFPGGALSNIAVDFWFLRRAGYPDNLILLMIQ